MNPRENIPWLAAAIFALIAATLAGVNRIGWRLPVITPNLIAQHGPLMVTGFLGTLITLERAVALRKRAALLGAVFFAVGAIVIMLDVSDLGGRYMTLLGSIWLVGIFIYILRLHRALHIWIMALASLFLFVGAVLWLSGRAVVLIVPWWIAFLVLTIAGERLELGRIIAQSPISRNLFLTAMSLFATGVVLSIVPINVFNAVFTVETALRIMGLGLIALSMWLYRYDVARQTIRKPGITRFIAICMLTGYYWLFAGGVFYLWFGLELGGLFYDAQLHAIFLGFVFSMIFGHAPIIFPAILGREIKYHWRFYIHYAFLQVSLFIRISGDLLLIPELRKWGGMLNGVAILLFLINTASAIFLAED